MSSFPSTTSRVRAATWPRFCHRKAGLTSMPTETKNRTENASRKANTSAPTWWLRCDWLMMAPATKAPSASETPNSSAAAHGGAQGDRQDRQDEQLARAGVGDALQQPGDQARPDKKHDRNKSGCLQQGDGQVSPVEGPPRLLTRAGISTRMSTERISSITSQPTAACPCEVFSSELSIRPRSSTTVLATETASPSTIPEATDQPHSWVNAEAQAGWQGRSASARPGWRYRAPARGR